MCTCCVCVCVCVCVCKRNKNPFMFIFTHQRLVKHNFAAESKVLRRWSDKVKVVNNQLLYPKFMSLDVGANKSL